ncbi:PhzF family phenazine biosynthesis protein [Echinicola shivajiensis]|uniref:PhzF family phenazine biosynthesis protein n=1 Tax=Echinicola shivajiensis TaxID=1035916 RepID=UPI001BFC8411|nr:PhzF family phenazine biosynthesis isomerase [Echinicola shivajiensis]
MDIQYQIISVFTDQNKGFQGNPSAVILLYQNLSDAELKEIAIKLDQPATTFLWKIPGTEEYKIRWFAPSDEIGLCGHGTAAATAFLSQKLGVNGPFRMHYAEGIVEGQVNADQTISISINAIIVQEKVEKVPEEILNGLGAPILGMYRTANKYIILTDSEKSVQQMKPDFEQLKKCDIFGYAVTAQGEGEDFVSRTIIPHTKILEDSATGSSHAMLVPFWAERLGKEHFKAAQFSPRGGTFVCELKASIVKLCGEYVLEEKGTINI